jgi:hypothetical protein
MGDKHAIVSTVQAQPSARTVDEKSTVAFVQSGPRDEFVDRFFFFTRSSFPNATVTS